MSDPTITIDPTTNLLTLDTGDPHPDSITVHTELLATLIAEVNLSRLRAKVLTELHASLGKVLGLGATP